MAKRPHTQVDLEQPEQRYRFRGQISPQEAERSGARSQVTATKDGNTAVLRIYDVIDSWGEFWGISANEVISALDALGEVDTVQVRINSPGGEATEGVAIYNALVAHPAKIEVYVDALAASAASIVAMAGDTIEMLTGSEMMIHDAWGICFGNQDEMAKYGRFLGHVSDNLATVYKERAGGTAASWRAAMKEETWYSPEEAVTAGLATSVAKKRTAAKDEPKARFDLSVFNHSGRKDAPAPRLDTTLPPERASVPNSSKQRQENNNRMLTPEQLEIIGIAADASEDQINARLGELAKNETTTPDGDESDTDEDSKGGDSDEDLELDEEATSDEQESERSNAQASFTVPDGAVLVDKAQWQEVQSSMATLNKMQADAKRAERDDVIKAAIRQGKFAPKSQKHYETLWESNASATRALIDSLEPNAVPVAELGHGGDADVTEDDAYPDSWNSALQVTGGHA